MAVGECTMCRVSLAVSCPTLLPVWTCYPVLPATIAEIRLLLALKVTRNRCALLSRSTLVANRTASFPTRLTVISDSSCPRLPHPPTVENTRVPGRAGSDSGGGERGRGGCRDGMTPGRPFSARMAASSRSVPPPAESSLSFVSCPWDIVASHALPARQARALCAPLLHAPHARIPGPRAFPAYPSIELRVSCLPAARSRHEASSSGKARASFPPFPQVEYAIEAINQAGACIGLLTSTGVVLVAEKKITSKLLDAKAVGVKREKMYLLDDHVACAVAGITSDANILISSCRLAAQASCRMMGGAAGLRFAGARCNELRAKARQCAVCFRSVTCTRTRSPCRWSSWSARSAIASKPTRSSGAR